jgi:GPH family glycoside/pentoside/hexuronide:cation symporter
VSTALRRRTKIAYASGDAGVAIFLTVTGSFLLYYLTDVLGANPSAAGLALILPKFWDVITDPLMGMISDRTRSSMGRRRPYLLFGGVGFAASMVLLFALPHWVPAFGGVTGVALLYAFSCTAFTIYATPYCCMTAEITESYSERTEIAAWRQFFVIVAALFAGAATMAMVKAFGGGTAGFFRVSLVLGVVILCFSSIAFVSTRGLPSSRTSLESLSWKEQMGAVMANRPFRALFSAFFIQQISVGVFLAGIIYQIKYVLALEEERMGIVFICFYVTAALSVPMWVRVASRLQKRDAYSLGVVLVSASFLSAFAFASSSFVLFCSLMVTGGVGAAAFMVFSQAMLPDTIEFDAARSGARREGVFYGVFSSGQKTANAFGPAIVGIMLDAFGFLPGLSAEEQSPRAILGIRIAVVAGPALLFLLSLIPLRRYHIDAERFEELKRQARERATASQGGAM